jgi:hypothetical protein
MDQDQPSTPPPQEETMFPAEEFSMDGYDKYIRNARIVLFVVAALQLLAIYMLPAANSQDLSRPFYHFRNPFTLLGLSNPLRKDLNEDLRGSAFGKAFLDHFAGQ